MKTPPVFIVGSPRSGTYLLQRCLNQHPNLAILGETHFFSVINKLSWRFGDLREPANRKKLISHFMQAVPIYFADSPDPSALEKRLRDEAVSYPVFFETLLVEYARQRGKTRCGEKTPEHAFYIQQIRQLFPGAKILHMVRDPRAVTASLMKMPWAPSDVLSNAHLWKQHVEAAENHRGHSYYKRIHYEDLVQGPEQTLAQICSFLEEPVFNEWQSVFDSPSNASAWWRERSFGPITAERVRSWETVLTSEQIAVIEQVAGPLMRDLGYEPVAALVTLNWRKKLEAYGRFYKTQTARFFQPLAWHLSPRPLTFFHKGSV